MKTMLLKFYLTLFLALITTSASAQIVFDEKRVTHIDMVNLYQFNCQINLGSPTAESREITVLEGHLLNERLFSMAHFSHTKAFAIGCDLEVLDRLVNDSFSSFSHAEAKVTLIIKTAKLPRVYRGKCVRNIEEEVVIDFQQGTILKTGYSSKLIPAVGCK